MEPARARLARARALRAGLEHDRARRKLADLDALGAVSAYHRRALDLLAAQETRLAAVRAVQAHLACDGLFQAPSIDASYTWQTSTAVKRFQHGAMILPTGLLDAQTREAISRAAASATSGRRCACSASVSWLRPG